MREEWSSLEQFHSHRNCWACSGKPKHCTCRYRRRVKSSQSPAGAENRGRRGAHHGHRQVHGSATVKVNLRNTWVGFYRASKELSERLRGRFDCPVWTHHSS